MTWGLKRAFTGECEDIISMSALGPAWKWETPIQGDRSAIVKDTDSCVSKSWRDYECRCSDFYINSWQQSIHVINNWISDSKEKMISNLKIVSPWLSSLAVDLEHQSVLFLLLNLSCFFTFIFFIGLCSSWLAADIPMFVLATSFKHELFNKQLWCSYIKLYPVCFQVKALAADHVLSPRAVAEKRLTMDVKFRLLFSHLACSLAVFGSGLSCIYPVISNYLREHYNLTQPQGVFIGNGVCWTSQTGG